MTKYIILLRAVNVGATRKLVMAELRAALIGAGYADAVTYIQSGNIVLSTDASAAAVEDAVETLIANTFGMKAIAIARSSTDFARLAATNPFPDAVPKMLHLCLTKRARADGAEILLRKRASPGERIIVTGSAVWIDFGAGGVGGSKLTPAFLDKTAGSTLTARNINTVAKLCELAGV